MPGVQEARSLAGQRSGGQELRGQLFRRPGVPEASCSGLQEFLRGQEFLRSTVQEAEVGCFGGQEFLRSAVQEVAARGRLGVDGRMLSFNRARSSSSSLRASKGQDEV